MRIVVVQPWISYRGSETVSVLQTYYLKQIGHSTSLCCLYVDSKYAPPHSEDISYFLPHIMLQKIFSFHIFLYLFSVPALFFLLYKKRNEYDIVLAHNYPSLWVGALIKVFCKKRLLGYVHGVPPQSGLPKGKFFRFVWNLGVDFWDKWAVDKCDNLIAVSKKVQKDIRNRYRKSSVVVYPPVEYSLFSKQDENNIRKKYALSLQSKLLLQVSDLVEEKGADIALEAFRSIRKVYPDSVFMFVGVKNMRSEFLETKNVILVPFVSPQSVCDYMREADVLVNPSWISEGCSVVPLQAALCGTPSVVVYNSGVDELFNNNSLGIVTHPFPDDISQAVITLLKRKKRIDRRKIVQLVDPKKHVKQLSRVINE